MADNITYAEQHSRKYIRRTRDVLKELPDLCADFVRAIETRTSALTRYVYVCDLKLFLFFLTNNVERFKARDPVSMTASDFESISAREIEMFAEFLSLYDKDDTERVNTNPGKMQKLSALRSFYKYLTKNELIRYNATLLVDMPKIYEKPILRMELDETARMLDYVETGEMLATQHQQVYNEKIRIRDLAILTVFLDTGIRVSELVGLNISDLDFNVNGFTVTRKGGNRVTLYFSDEVEQAIKTYLEQRNEITACPGHEDALFLSTRNQRISVRAVEIMVKKYATQAAPLKTRLSPHKLRSTFGTNLYHETGDIYLVADVLGHSDINTTRAHYAAMTDDRRRMAATKVRIRDEHTATANKQNQPDLRPENNDSEEE